MIFCMISHDILHDIMRYRMIFLFSQTNLNPSHTYLGLYKPVLRKHIIFNATKSWPPKNFPCKRTIKEKSKKTWKNSKIFMILIFYKIYLYCATWWSRQDCQKTLKVCFPNFENSRIPDLIIRLEHKAMVCFTIWYSYSLQFTFGFMFCKMFCCQGSTTTDQPANLESQFGLDGYK